MEKKAEKATAPFVKLASEKPFDLSSDTTAEDHSTKVALFSSNTDEEQWEGQVVVSAKSSSNVGEVVQSPKPSTTATGNSSEPCNSQKHAAGHKRKSFKARKLGSATLSGMCSDSCEIPAAAPKKKSWKTLKALTF